MSNNMRRWCVKVLVSVMVLFALVFVADWIVLQNGERSLPAHSSVMVNNSFIIHQKSGRLEYLYDSQPTPCVRSLFPHQGQPACWWLARHTEQQKEITAN